MIALIIAAVLATPAHLACDGEGRVAMADMRLLPVAAQEFAASFASKAVTHFGPFGRPYDIERIDVFTTMEDRGESDGLPGDERTLRVGLAVHRHGAVRYYGLADEEGTGLDATDESPSDREGRPQVDIRLGTPDHALPIIRIAITTTYRGVHSSGAHEVSTYLDFGFSTPRVIAETECDDGWMGGACTAYDSAYSTRPRFACRWSDEKRDYACEQRQELDAGWTKRHAVKDVELFAGRTAPPHGALAPADFATLVRGEPQSDTVRIVAGVGPLRRVGVLAGRWVLFATTCGGYAETLELYAVDLTNSAPPRAIDVITLDESDDEFDLPLNADVRADDKDDRAAFTPVGDAFAIDVNTVVREQSLHVVSVLLTESGHRALFWAGGDAADGTLSAVRLASDAPEYRHCNRFEIPDSVSRVELSTPFAAVLHVEPHWTVVNDEAEANSDAEFCMRTARLTWRGGFQLAWSTDSCRHGLPARRVTIGPRGELATAALPPQTTQ